MMNTSQVLLKNDQAKYVKPAFNMNQIDKLSLIEQETIMTQLAKKALEHYNIDSDAELKLLSYRENAVFQVKTKGKKYALRVHRYQYHTDEELHSEFQWMEALIEYGLQIPTVVQGKTGDTIYHVTTDEMLPYQVDLLTWVEGSNPNPKNIVSTYYILGQLSAKLHQHSSVWDKPEGFVRYAWDEEGMLGANPAWGRYEDLTILSSKQLNLLHQARELALTKLKAYDKTQDSYSNSQCKNT